MLLLIVRYTYCPPQDPQPKHFSMLLLKKCSKINEALLFIFQEVWLAEAMEPPQDEPRTRDLVIYFPQLSFIERSAIF